MIENDRGSFDVAVGDVKIFSNLDFDEALSGLLFIGALTGGICRVNGEKVCDFIDGAKLPHVINIRDLVV